ncbi:MAG: ribonuclease HII [Eubacteriaceae bacterium]|nr:ribonuclease HII [Eubacteriaceae bacterium]
MFNDKTIEEIKEYFKTVQISSYCEYYDMLLSDSRKNVTAFAYQLQKREETYKKELNRIDNMIKAQSELFESDTFAVAGIDEVGRGPLAGPVVACAVIMSSGAKILHINDSKKLSEKMREELYIQIQENSLSIGIGIIDNARIDKINILNATKEAMKSAVSDLKIKPDALIIDAVKLPIDIIQKSPIKADEKYYSVAAASIIAKVTRDNMMKEYALKYPQYGFCENKGYGTAEHIEAIHKYGPCPIHRQSFIKNISLANSKTKGNSGEYDARQYLINKGYEIIRNNYSTQYGEIDIIFKDNEYLVFCEVKTRKNSEYGTGAMAVGLDKINKITKTALVYITENEISDMDIRFDIIEVYDDGKVVHIDNAFMAMA